MYTEYFGFRGDPFADTVDPAFFYTNPIYQKAHSTLLAGIREYKGFLLLTGETGTGKTTLLRRIMKEVEASGHYVFFDSTSLASATIDDLLYFICAELGLHGDDNGRVAKLRRFSAYLNALVSKGGTGVLLVDEAHHLNDEVLGGLRLIAPLDMKSERLLLQIVLVGQPELERRLEQPKLRPIYQRVALRCRLDRLKDEEIAAYIQHRLQTVGCERHDLFAAEAVQRIAHSSQGIPRLINIICDNALLLAYGEKSQTVSAQLIDEAVERLRIEEMTNAAPLVAPILPSPDSPEVPALALVSPPLEAAFVSQPGERDVHSGHVTGTATRSRVWGFLALGLLLVLGTGWFLHAQRVSLLSLFSPQPPVITRVTQEVNRPPQIVSVLPQERTVEVQKGASQSFAVTLEDPDAGQRVEAVWFFDEEQVAQGVRWTFSPQPTIDEGYHTVKVTGTDSAGTKVERQWIVTVLRGAPELPRIIRTQPVNLNVNIKEGQAVTFAVEVTNSQPETRYLWLLDGKEQAQGSRWIYQPQFTDGGQEKTITVQVRHLATQGEERSWKVSIQDVNRPPVIAAVEPRTQLVKTRRGEEQRFVITMTDPDLSDRLSAAWMLDGKEMARGPTWTFTPPLDEASAQHLVTVSVTDQHGMQAEKQWRVTVVAVEVPPLQFTNVQPALSELTLTIGQPVAFAVEVPQDRVGVQYVWLLDGQEQSRRRTWTYAPQPEDSKTDKTVTVRVQDQDTQPVERSWQLHIQAMTPPPAPVPLPTPATVPPLVLNESEVRAWVEAQRRALEERDVDALVELGALNSQQAERARQILSQYKNFRVAFRNLAVHVEEDRAEVSFSRVDTIEGTEVPHADRKRFFLQKGAGGRISARPQ